VPISLIFLSLGNLVNKYLKLVNVDADADADASGPKSNFANRWPHAIGY
jgi:hypothetical protein